MTIHEKKAEELFRAGYNCAQAAFCAYAEELNMDIGTAARLASSFGGGMGRMREVCGAVSGMLLIAGILYGYDSTDDDEKKKAHYTLVQELAAKFRQRNGSIICRDILKNPPTDPAPTPRTQEYYDLRPCAKMVYDAVDILEDYIAEHPVK